MNSTLLQEAETKFSFSDLRKSSNPDRVQKIKNSCLKTADEMEVDFWKETMKGGLTDTQQLRNNRDGYLNTNPERIDSGFMEENY